MRRIRRGGAVLFGALLALGGLVAVAPPAGAAPTAFVLYAPLNGSARCGLASIDLATGDLTPIGSTVAGAICDVADLALAPDGTLYGVSFPNTTDVDLVRIDTTSGAVTDLGSIGGVESLGGAGLAFDAAGTLFVMAGLEDGVCNPTTSPVGAPFDACLYQLDPNAPATPTFVGPLGVDSTDTVVTTLAVACDGRMITSILDFTNVTANQVAAQAPFEPVPPPWDGGVGTLATFPAGVLATVDPASGATTIVGPYNVDNPPFGFAFDGDELWATGTRPFGIRALGTTYSIDGGTGAATAVATATLPGEDQLALGPTEIAPLSACEVPAAPIVVTPTFAG